MAPRSPSVAPPPARFVKSPFLVPFHGAFDAHEARTTPPRGAPRPAVRTARLARAIERIGDEQHRLLAHDRHSVLAVFQGLDASGKDGTIRAVMTGINPAGCQVFSFKQPSLEELDHDFLWRTSARLPERGRIGIFNRSYYEEVLVVRVHPDYLQTQKLPDDVVRPSIWDERLESIRDHEKHLARSGVVVVKFWLNVSKSEQRSRFMKRIKDPASRWKFNAGDVAERRLFDRYLDAYGDALRQTSRPWAPWYAIPADDKAYMRMVVAEILASTLESLGLAIPKLAREAERDLRDAEQMLRAE